jgi:hypothetical protein
MKNYPKEFYAKEDKMIHKVGYTAALGMMGIGVVELLHGGYYAIQGKGGNLGLGIVTTIAGGIVAYEYLREAKVVY